MGRPTGDREGVRQRVQREMGERGWNIIDLAREAGVDAGTVGDFLSGPRWPNTRNRGKISRAFGWSADGIDQLAAGQEPQPAADETVGAADQDAGVLLSLPPGALDGLDAAEREEVISAAKATLLERARAIRRRVDQ